MTTSQKFKTLLLGLVYGTNLFFALALWLCGESGNILFGIFCIILYRLSLWCSPIAITIICWLPSRPKVPVHKKFLFYFAHLCLCVLLFLTCFLIFGNWY